MNKVAALVAFGMALSPIWHRQQKSAETEPEEVQRQEIVNLENETARALQLSNSTFFRRVYSDDFAGTTALGQVIDKAKLIAMVGSSEVRYESVASKDIRVRIYGDTAVVTCHWIERGRYKGQLVSSQLRVLHVYVNGPRGWKVVAGQETSIPARGEQAH